MIIFKKCLDDLEIEMEKALQLMKWLFYINYLKFYL